MIDASVLRALAAAGADMKNGGKPCVNQPFRVNANNARTYKERPEAMLATSSTGLTETMELASNG